MSYLSARRSRQVWPASRCEERLSAALVQRRQHIAYLRAERGLVDCARRGERQPERGLNSCGTPSSQLRPINQWALRCELEQAGRVGQQQ